MFEITKDEKDRPQIKGVAEKFSNWTIRYETI